MQSTTLLYAILKNSKLQKGIANIIKNTNHIYTTMKNTLIYTYSILVNGKFVETKILGYKTANAHAHKYTGDLFGKRKVEILCIETAEIKEIQ